MWHARGSFLYIYLSLCEIKINFASIQLDRIINPSKHSREPKLLKEDVRRNQTYVLQMDMEGGIRPNQLEEMQTPDSNTNFV